MFDEELNLSTLNHRFRATDSGSYISEPITQAELEAAREHASIVSSDHWIIRSCWECNAAHVHLIDGLSFMCFACGRFYHNGVDITDYSESEYAEHVKLREPK